MREAVCKVVEKFKEWIGRVAWKIRLFISCVCMDVKNYRLKRRIKAARVRAAKAEKKLQEIREERK